MANKMSRFTKLATKPVRLPLNWLVSRHTIDATKEFRFKSQRYPLCPHCSLSRFVLLDEGLIAKADNDQVNDVDNKPRPAIWECPACLFQVETRHADIKSIQNWCVDNAHNVYVNSDFQAQVRSAFENSQTDEVILGQLSNNYLALLLGYYFSLLASAMAAVRLLYSIYSFTFYRDMAYWIIASPFLIVFFLALTVMFNYFMWQSLAKTAKTAPRETFAKWRNSHSIFSLPSFEVTIQSSVQKSIRVYMLACYGALLVAVVMGLSFMYAAYNLKFFYMINTLLFTIGALFIALVFNYRAWQAFSNNIYTPNAKKTFHWWIGKHPWYVSPKDIGLPPSSNAHN